MKRTAKEVAKDLRIMADCRVCNDVAREAADLLDVYGVSAQRVPTEPRFEKLRARLLHSITTASNDDISNPMSAKRERHCERVSAMYVAIDFIDAALGLGDTAVTSTYNCPKCGRAKCGCTFSSTDNSGAK